MPISNRHTSYVQKKINTYPAADQRYINDALDELEQNHSAPNYRCIGKSYSYGDTFPTIEVVNDILIDYKFDIVGLVTIIDIRRSPWYPLKVLLGDFSPPGGRI
jgi:hypothetical protein